MAQSLKQIKNRIRTIESTEKVTSAMQLISVVKLNSTNRIAYAFKPYSFKLEAMVRNMAADEKVRGHPFFEQRRTLDKILLCVITSDNGLCGFYNQSIIRCAEEFLDKHGRDNCELLVIGKKGWNYFKSKNIKIIHRYLGLNGRYSDIISDEITSILINLFLTKKANAVHVAHMRFETAAVQKPGVEKLLNIDLPEEGRQTPYLVEPDIGGLLAELLPKYVKSTMRRIFLESFVCEHAARSLSMKKATDNAAELLKNLVLTRNKIRQASITQDIMEVISSAEALKG